MAYRISLTNGSDLVTVSDGTINAIGSASSLTLVGKNFAGYGQYLNENYIRLLENFANTSTNPPPSALEGQLWWDSTPGAQALKVRRGGAWVAASGINSSATDPSLTGTPNVGEYWWDSVNQQLKVWNGTGWVVVGPAYSVLQGPTGTFAGTTVDSSYGTHTLVEFKVGGQTLAVLSADPAYTLASNANISGFTVGQTIYPGFTMTTNEGTLPSGQTYQYNGVSVQARYADLAERFASDKPYLPGTIVSLGGPEEITSTVEELSDNVFGVISTKAAYLMNCDAGTNETHPPVAMQGRCPVRVIGKIKKGDRLVSAGNGLARAAARQEVTSFNVIGRALENKSTTDEGTVEAIVKMNS